MAGIGDYKLIKLYKYTTGKDAAGNNTETLSLKYRTYADVTDAGGSRGTQGGQNNLSDVKRFKIRWREDWVLNGNWNIKYFGNLYAISKIERIKEGRFNWLITADAISAAITTSSTSVENFSSFTYDQVTGLITFAGTAGSYLTQIRFLDPDTQFTYVNSFNEAYSVSAFSGNTITVQYFTPGDVLVSWRRVRAGSFAPLTEWTDYLLTVTRLPRRDFVLYDFDTNNEFTSLLFPAKPINVDGTELATVNNMTEYVTAMNTDVSNQAVFTILSYSETSRIDVLIEAVSPYQDYDTWDRILKANRV